MRTAFICIMLFIVVCMLDEMHDTLKAIRYECTAPTPVMVECDTDSDCARKNGGDGR